MAGRDGEGKVFAPGSRKRDQSVDDALRTMERLALWLDEALQNNAWKQTEEALQTAMLHGMLIHLRGQIDALIDLGGDDVAETARALRTLASQDDR